LKNLQKPAAPKPVFNQPKKEFHKPDNHNNNHQNNRPARKDDGPAKPVDDDMLKMLAEKFKKGL